MPETLRVSATYDVQTRMLRNMIARLEDQREAFEAIGGDLQYQVWQCFETGTDPYGFAWAPLKNPPKRRRGGQILRDTGNLHNSITYRADDHSVEVGTLVEYAAYHQFGAPDSNLPRRAFLPITGSFESPQVVLPQPWVDSIRAMLAEALAAHA